MSSCELRRTDSVREMQDIMVLKDGLFERVFHMSIAELAIAV